VRDPRVQAAIQASQDSAQSLGMASKPSKKISCLVCPLFQRESESESESSFPPVVPLSDLIFSPAGGSAPAFRTKPLGMGLLAYHTRDSGQIFESKLYLALQSTVQYPLAQSDVGRVEGASVCVGLFGGFSTEVLSWRSLLPVPCVLQGEPNRLT
jgi:hypothetical protein